ncbi:MAG TPA: 2-amino-4-hydroxy-6-hydroxymethyldihydropteridine diphosphokinase [Rhodocyclaceae bacterium]|nr:2-amino-4-hydroxy-6-hydroxymethyldihydropteridine diphosphokinase [Rhodocyclaceae bacterium]
MSVAYVALGSNLQQPQAQVTQALRELSGLPQTQVTASSSLYRTAPLGYDDQPDFINAVARLETSLAPLALLRALLALEDTHGRERPFPNAPRVLDLDLLLYDDIAMQTPELTLPHPRMQTRGFVMLPLAEIAPGLKVGAYGEAAQLDAACIDQGVQRMPSDEC